MTDLEQICENALYDEIRVLEDGKSVVRDIPTGKLYFKKTLDVYNEHVFTYLRDHRNRHVTAVQSFWKEGDKLVVIEELIQGRTLEEILSEHPEELTFSDRIDYLTQICDGLQFLHSADPPIIHRDIKASNIMVTDDGIVKIIDYDAAKIFVKGQKKDTVMIGTQGLAAPEQYGFAQSNVRTDLYALGKLIERMLPGNYDAKRIADKATEMDPKKRYTSAEQMKGQIRRIREHESKLDRKFEKIPGFDPMNRSHRIRARIGLAAGVLAVIALVTFAGWRLLVYPNIVAEQLRAQMAVINETSTADDKLVHAVENFVQTHSYQKMSDAQKKAVRDGMENAVMRCCKDSKEDDAQAIRDILTSAYGEEEVWETVYEYGKADFSLQHYDYEEAFSALSGLREDGAVDAQEHWDTAAADTLAKARSHVDQFKEQNKSVPLKYAASEYAVLIKYGAETGDTDLQKEYGEQCSGIIATAKALCDEHKWDDAMDIYQKMIDAGIGDTEAGQKALNGADLEELIRATQYAKAEVLYAEKSYSEAAAAYEKAGEYGDAEDKFKESVYQAGCAELESGSYDAAVSMFSKIPGYKDADQLALDAKYGYCENTKEKPYDSTYEFIEELLAADYEGAAELRDEIYTWRAAITTGMSYSFGPMQSAYIKCKLAGGPPDGTAIVKYEIYDFTRGETDTWTDKTEHRAGETSEVDYSEEDSSYSLFDRTYRVRIYVNGDLVETWEGQFSTSF